jgi:predicted transcriptional regulator
MVLDHSGHAGTHARGSSRKSQNVQVVYKVEKKEPFDRTTSGRQKLTREKDRLAYLPSTVEVTLGGYPFGFKTKYDGQEFLNNSQNTALYMLYKCGLSGATHGEWKVACEKKMSARTFNRAVEKLGDEGYIEAEGKRYYLTNKGKSKVS